VTGFQPAENIKNQYISNSYQHLTHAFINLFPRRASIVNNGSSATAGEAAGPLDFAICFN
jgi:hypothetical protein